LTKGFSFETYFKEIEELKKLSRPSFFLFNFVEKASFIIDLNEPLLNEEKMK
jgi:hypothetical protein